MVVRVENYASLAEAARALGSGGTRYMGGGTLVMRDINAGTPGAERIVRCSDPALGLIQLSGDAVSIGAGVTMAQVIAHRDLAFLAPVARWVGGPQVRAMASVGGNLFAGGDLTVGLLALGARVVIAGQSGAARPLDEVLRDRARVGLVAAIEVPRPRDPRAFSYLKVCRVKPRGMAVLSIAALLPRDGGRIRAPRVAYGAMGPVPMRAAAVERVLEGQALDAGSIARAAQVAAEGFDPPTDAIASGWYRREVAGVHLKRLLERMERG